MPYYSPFLILAFAGGYLPARLIAFRSGSRRWLAAGFLIGVTIGFVIPWLLRLVLELAGWPSTTPGLLAASILPDFPAEWALWFAALGSAMGASFGDWIRRQRAAGHRSRLHAMAPVALTAVLVLLPLAVLTFVLVSNWASQRPLPEAPSPLLASEGNRALI